MAAKKGVNKRTGKGTKTAVPTKPTTAEDRALGFGNPYRNPNRVLEGPVTKGRKDVKVDKKRGRPDRPLKGPVGLVFPITNTKAPRRGRPK